MRTLLGPWHLDREEAAYRRLAGLPGTAAFLERVDRQAILLSCVAGRPLARFEPGALPARFFDDLERLLEAVHARGVAHGDLHRHDVLVTDEGRPCVVDFSTALCAPPGADPVLGFVFRQMRRADRRAAAKLRRRFMPAASGAVPERPALYRIGAHLRRLFSRRPR